MILRAERGLAGVLMCDAAFAHRVPVFPRALVSLSHLVQGLSKGETCSLAAMGVSHGVSRPARDNSRKHRLAGLEKDQSDLTQFANMRHRAAVVSPLLFRFFPWLISAIAPSIA